MKRPNPTSWVFRNWYPVFYVATCYKEMALFIPATGRRDADQWLADLDFRIWHANPTVWLERIYSPVADRVPASGVYALRTGGAVRRVPAVEEATLRRVPILCFFNRRSASWRRISDT